MIDLFDYNYQYSNFLNKIFHFIDFIFKLFEIFFKITEVFSKIKNYRFLIYL
jgi:hypothetical protein